MTRTVLVVDDDVHLRTGMVALIQSHGHRTIVAGTVAEGLEKLISGPSHLLLDLNLPDGIGTTVLRHIREAHLPIRVAILSGTSESALLAEANELEPDALFRKPPDWDVVMDWIAT